jgi:hypothetical protein
MPESSENLRSRLAFISRIGGGVVGLTGLAACGGRGAGGALLPASSGLYAAGSRTVGAASPPVADTADIQAFMRGANIYAISQGGSLVVRDDMKSNSSLVRNARNSIHADSCPELAHGRLHSDLDCGGGDGDTGGDSGTGGGDNGEGTTGSGGSGAGGTGTATGLKIIATVACSAGTVEAYAASYSTYYIVLYAVTPTGQTPISGPQYTIPKPLQCLESTVTDAEAFLKNLAGAIISGAVSLPGLEGWSTLAGSASGFLAGTVSLEGFADVAMAVITAAAWPEVLATIGISITAAALVDFLACEFSQD